MKNYSRVVAALHADYPAVVLRKTEV